MGKRKAKPTPGHKCGGVQVSVKSRCECGWEGDAFCGQGARAGAYNQWRIHIEDVHAGKPILCSCHLGRYGRACDACVKGDHAACGSCSIAFAAEENAKR